MVDAAGGLYPRVALMLDVESGGNPPETAGELSGLTGCTGNLAAGSPVRIIGAMPTLTTSSTCGVFAGGLSWHGLWFQSGTFPDKWHQYTDGSGIAPIFHRAPTVRSMRYELRQRD